MFQRTTQTPFTQLVAAAAAALFATGGAMAQFVPRAASHYAAGSQPSGLAFGDYDGDGDVDLATTVDGPDRIFVLLNDGTGQYVAGPASLLPASSSPQDVEAGDFDGDGDVDLAVAVRDPAGSVITMLNNGAGSFAMSGTAVVGDRPRGLSVRDVDGDGDLDLAVANRNSNSASVLLNSGAGTFAVSQTLAIGGEARWTTFGDFDGDGDPDLAVTNHDAATVLTFSNAGGTFSPGMTLSVGGVVRPDGVDASDLNNDGNMDLAVATSDQTLNISRATVFLSTGAGFSGPFNYDTLGSNASSIVAVDFDCDGLNDIAVANADSNDVSLLRNIGAGIFGAAQVVAVGTTPDDITTADLDGDGDSDVATANRDSNNVSVIMNDTCDIQPCPWDTSADGLVNIVDLLDLLAAWGPNPGHAADFDGSGFVDIVDLLALLAAWGNCP